MHPLSLPRVESRIARVDDGGVNVAYGGTNRPGDQYSTMRDPSETPSDSNNESSRSAGRRSSDSPPPRDVEMAS